MTTEIAKMLLKAEAVTLRPAHPFIFASGIKSPIYTDNRILISLPETRKKIVSAYCKEIKSKWEPDVIIGVATAGIPWAAWIAAEMNLPMVFVRLAAKDHGKNNQIEGILKKDSKAVVVEDLISSGQSTLGVVKAVREQDVEVLGCISIFTYGFKKAKDAFDKENVELKTLTNLDELLRIAVEEKFLDKNEKELVTAWVKNPEDWGK